jgi:hypothetical protein
VSDTVPFGSYDDVLIIDEWDKTEPDARSHKSYARGVGHIRVASKGRLDQETLVLTKIEQLDANEMEKARKAAIKLEQSARDLAPDEYGLTQPLELASKAKAKPRAPAQPSPVRKVSYIGSPDPAKPGTEEFGLSPRQLVMAIEQAESSIAACMREQGFEYVAVDYRTIRRGMNADKRLPGLTESEFIHKYGYGLSTLYTGAPPQDTNGYSPAKMGLGRKNIEIYRGLSPADRVAYNRALLGEAISQTLSVGLESENFNRTGGCTRQAVEQVFSPEQLKATYVNPKDVIIYRDPRMKAAVREYAKRMRDAGFEYGHPDDVEADILQRLDALTDGRSIRVEALPPDRAAALEKLKDFERRVAVASLALELEFFEPIEERVFTEMFGRKDQTP